MMASSSCEIASHTRSRSPSNSPRRSRLNRDSPGTMFTAPGNASSWPTVPMMWCSDRQMRSTASAASEAPSSASRRMSYGVPPACRASPSTSSWNLRALAMDETTASASPRRSSSGPCSMCASRYPTRSDGRRAASPMRPGSSPKSRKASRTVVPSASVSVHQSSCQLPATAEEPSSALPNRVPSSSEKAMTSSAKRNGDRQPPVVRRAPAGGARPRARSARPRSRRNGPRRARCRDASR